jgi:hypothetical protein
MISPFEQSSFKKPSSVKRLISVGSGGPTKTAICIGINKYPPGYPSLTKCVDDAKAWQSLLTSRGFKCTMLLDEAATKANILSTITSVIAKNRKAGSIIVITNSSHGSQVIDTSGDESDNRDEVICPCDWSNYVSDDNLRAIFQNLAPGVKLEIYLDCCHSGTGSRDIGFLPDGVLSIRSLPPIIKEKSNKGIKARGFIEVSDLNHVLVAACKDSEVSYELSVGGALTYYAIQAIKLGYNRQQMIDYVQSKIAALGLIQTPQLECTQVESLHQPFA